MSIETYRRRIVYQLTTPPALLYTLTRHWLIVSFFFGCGLLWVLASTVLAPPIYEGKATLQINLQSTVVSQDDLAPRPRASTPREEDERFFQRVAMLKGDSVLQKLVEQLREDLAKQMQEPDDVQEESTVKENDTARQLVRGFRRAVRAAKKLVEGEPAAGMGEEYMVQTAIEGFRATSSVVAQPDTSTVELLVYGPNREFLKTQLDKWIDAYKDRTEDLARETVSKFTIPMVNEWTKKEAVARSELEAFKQANPDVNTDRKELLYQRAIQLQTVMAGIVLPEPVASQRMPAPAPVAPTATLAEDPQLQALHQQRRQLDGELQTALRSYAPTSDVVKGLERGIASLDQQIAAKEQDWNRRREEARQSADAQAQAALAAAIEADKLQFARDEKIREAAEKIRKEKEDKINADYNATMASLAAVTKGLEQLKALEENYDKAKQTRKRYEGKLTEEIDRVESQRNVEVQVRDDPQVGVTPHKSSQRKEIALGLVGGLGVGVVLALLLEVMRSKVRFKSDVANELALPVVGVFPRN